MSELPKEKEHVSQIWLANTQRTVWFVESCGNDDLAYVAGESNDIQQRVINQESLRRATAEIEQWLGVKGGRPGEKIEQPADALTGKMNVSASVS